MIANTEPQSIGELSIETRGGSGPASKLNPDPRATHQTQPKVGGVCK
jgi:hypothetical protein